jgi:predicted amidophosphoribosyltransferase
MPHPRLRAEGLRVSSFGRTISFIFCCQEVFMALKPCPECGKEVSEKAVSCPHCGCELKRRVLHFFETPQQALISIVTGIVVFLLVVYFD